MSSQITDKEQAAQLLERIEWDMEAAQKTITSLLTLDLHAELKDDLELARHAVDKAAQAVADAHISCFTGLTS